MVKQQPESDLLKGWPEIAKFLGEPVAVVQRWAKQSKLPVSRQGRFVVATPDDLNQWLAAESGGEEIHVVHESTDLTGDLKRALASVRQGSKGERKNASQPKMARSDGP